MTLITISEQRKIADKVLSKIEIIDPQAIIAGGAPRDWELGYVAKDIDVFFFMREETTPEEAEYSLKGLGFDVRRKVGEQWTPEWDKKKEEYSSSENLSAVFECVIEGITFQFMQMDKSTTTSVVDKFPVNISKIWYKNGAIVPTDDFKHAVKNVTIVKTMPNYPDDHPYIQKIRGKFPFYRYCSSYEDMIKNHPDYRALVQRIFSDTNGRLFRISDFIKEDKSKIKKKPIVDTSKETPF